MSLQFVLFLAAVAQAPPCGDLVASIRAWSGLSEAQREVLVDDVDPDAAILCGECIDLHRSSSPGSPGDSAVSDAVARSVRFEP